MGCPQKTYFGFCRPDDDGTDADPGNRNVSDHAASPARRRIHAGRVLYLLNGRAGADSRAGGAIENARDASRRFQVSAADRYEDRPTRIADRDRP